jgi:hypothetical protein
LRVMRVRWGHCPVVVGLEMAGDERVDVLH